MVLQKFIYFSIFRGLFFVGQSRYIIYRGLIRMDQKPYPPQNELAASERDFWNRLISTDEQIKAYEDEVLQAMARSLIPVDRLTSEAMKECVTTSMDDKVRDQLLLQLLRWFKYEFFTWTDKPKCPQCQGPTVYSAHLEPTPDEYRYGARRVEGYRCENCSIDTRFPRYNDPGKLLETRTGRCGEWANCFTLCCRALDFEARFVLDWTDHVWTEVYSAYQRRWLHCDPCENACDKPLLYEEGWGKKLTYVIAFSKDEVVDVSWRYSKTHRELWRRRLLCRESKLINFVDHLNEKRRSGMLKEHQQRLNTRALVECVELIWPRLEVKENETEGRTSGDLQWRQERGEVGNKAAAKDEGGYIFRPTDEEISNLSFTVEYYSSLDEYRRPTAPGVDPIRGWKSSVFHLENIFRKTEFDWKIVYLARTEKATTGSISWKFDFSKDDAIEIDRVSVKVDRTIYENGKIRTLLCQDSQCSPLDADGFVQVDQFDKSNCFEIKAILNGGKGDCAWQHAQLFRSPMENGHASPSFVVTVTLKKKSY